MKNIRKTAIKRKSVKVIKRIYTFLIIFLICFLILATIFIIKTFSKTTIINPSVIYSKTKNALTSQNNNQVQQLLDKNNIQYSSINNTNFGYLILLNQGTKVYLSNQKDLTSQINSLQVIQSHFTIEGKVPKSVDFRFDQPVVSF